MEDKDPYGTFRSPYFPRFYGKYRGVTLSKDNELTMNYLSTIPHKSLITLEFAANDISFVEYRSPGRIESVKIDDFLALGGSTNMTVTIQNMGSLTASYSVRFSDGD